MTPLERFECACDELYAAGIRLNNDTLYAKGRFYLTHLAAKHLSDEQLSAHTAALVAEQSDERCVCGGLLDPTSWHTDTDGNERCPNCCEECEET